MSGPPSSLTLIGLGAVELRLALAWKRAGLRVVAHSPSAASRERARAQGLDVEDQLAAALSGATAIVLCVPDARLESAAASVAAQLDPAVAPALVCLHTSGSRSPSVL